MPLGEPSGVAYAFDPEVFFEYTTTDNEATITGFSDLALSWGFRNPGNSLGLSCHGHC